MARFVNFSTRDVQILPDDALKGALLKLPNDVSKLPDGKLVIPIWERTRLSELLIDVLTDEQLLELQEALKIKDVVTTKTTLSNIEVGTIENDQRSRIRAALQLVDQNEVSKGWLKDDRTRLCYWSGSLYGVKRIVWADVTSSNQRTSYEGSNEAAPINGTGSANFANASNQWLTLFFNSRKVFKIVCRHTNNNWAYRKLAIAGSTKNLTASSGTYTYTWTPASGWADVGKVQFIDDGGNTSLDDLQILYADPDLPTLMNGQKLAIGDYFKVEGTTQLLRFEGVDTGKSGAWKASPVSAANILDTALDPISTNGVENRVVYSAIEELRRRFQELTDSLKDIEEPKLVLLDPIPDVLEAGDRAIEFRVYIDD